MKFLVGMICDFSVCGLIICSAGLCFGIHFTLPQVFGTWLVLLLLQMKIGGK